MQILAFIIWWNVVGMSRHSIICVHNQYWLFTIVVLMTLGKSYVTSVYFMANHRSRRNKETYNIMPLNIIAKFNHQMFGKAFAWEFFSCHVINTMILCGAIHPGFHCFLYAENIPSMPQSTYSPRIQKF